MSVLSACCGALSRVQVRVSPCGARGGAGRSRAPVWKWTERKLVCRLMERFLSVRLWALCLCADGLMSRRCGRSACDDWWAGAPREFPGQRLFGLGTLVTLPPHQASCPGVVIMWCSRGDTRCGWGVTPDRPAKADHIRERPSVLELAAPARCCTRKWKSWSARNHRVTLAFVSLGPGNSTGGACGP